MALDNNHLEYSYPAGADLTNKQYLAVKISSGQAVVASTGELGIGVLYTEASAAGRQVSVAISGVVKVIAGGTVTAGTDLTPDSAGKFVAVATTNRVWGHCLVGGVANDVITMHLFSSKPILV